MSLYQPYSTRLAQGTLLMFHPSTVQAGYVHIGQQIRFESMGLIGTGLLASAIGSLGRESLVVVCGMVAVLIGVLSWIVRGLRIRFRRRHTPYLLLISEEGIGAIFPNTTSLQLRWSDIRAREVRMQAQKGPAPAQKDTLVAGSQRQRSILLKGYDRQRLYLTSDLDGYAELLEILNDLCIRVHPPHGARLRSGISPVLRNGLERRLWQTRN